MTENITTEKTRPVRNFVKRHKTALTITATSLFWIALNQRAMRQHDEFLDEKGLTEEFYAPEATAEEL